RIGGGRITSVAASIRGPCSCSLIGHLGGVLPCSVGTRAGPGGETPGACATRNQLRRRLSADEVLDSLGDRLDDGPGCVEEHEDQLEAEQHGRAEDDQGGGLE